MKKYLQFLCILLELCCSIVIIGVILSGSYEANVGFTLTGGISVLPILFLGIITIVSILELVWKRQQKYPTARLIVLIMVDILAVITIMNKKFSLFNVMLLVTMEANVVLLIYSLITYKFKYDGPSCLPITFLCKRDLFRYLFICSVTIILLFFGMGLVLKSGRISLGILCFVLGIILFVLDTIVHFTQSRRLFHQYKKTLDYNKLKKKLDFYYIHVLNASTRFQLMYKECMLTFSLDLDKANQIFEELKIMDASIYELEYNLCLALYFLNNKRYNELDLVIEECKNYIRIYNKANKYSVLLNKIEKTKMAILGTLKEEELDLFFLDNRDLPKYDFYNNVYIRYKYYSIRNKELAKEYENILNEEDNKLTELKKK